MTTTKRTCKGVDESRLHVVAQGNVTMTSKGKATFRLPTVRKILLAVIVLSITATFAHAGGKKDKPATASRDISSFAGNWRSDTLLETVFDQVSGEEVSIPSTFRIWIDDDDGEVMFQADFIHWHYEPEVEVRGNTLVITTSGENGREEYAVLQITGNTLVRTVTENGRANRHIYTKRDE